MPLSISSSSGEAAIPRKIALTAIVVTGLYAVLIGLWQPDVRFGQDQGSDNAIAIERFLYGRPPAAAIVGSSQAERFPAGALGPDVANLALAGKNPLVGLSIIARSRQTPRRIYVEINHVDQPADTAFVDGVFAEPFHTLKRFVAALRTGYQPVNLAVSLMRRATRGRDEVYYARIVDPPLHDTLIARQQRLLARPPDPALLRASLTELDRVAALLAGRGAELVFFEMPIDPALEAASAIVAVRQAARAALPSDRICWNEDFAPAGVPSTDGIHLDSDTAAAFWAHLAATNCRRRPLSAEAPWRP
jgi:hypothetical protein